MHLNIYQSECLADGDIALLGYVRLSLLTSGPAMHAAILGIRDY